MTLVHRLPFLRQRIVVDSARTTRIGHVVVVDDGRIVNNGRVDIGVVDHSPVHIHDRGVVGKTITTPFTAGEADAHVAEAIIHAAIVADMRSPVTFKEAVMTAFPAPVRGRPKETGLRSRHPGARHPVIAVVAISPVSRGPEPSLFGARRLFIHH